jgi:beta-lactamase regulating signal transducer with metallopeptidase domain
LTPVAPIGIGTSLVLITLGAILKYAVDAGTLFGILDINTTGTILLIVGIVGLIIALAWTIMLTNQRRTPEVEREREYYDEPTRRRY